jgi:hypothetical protein
MTLVHLATGNHPLKIGQASIEKALKQSGISSRFTQFILGLIQPDPDKRPYDCASALKKLEQAGGIKNSILKLRNRDIRGEGRIIIGAASILPNSGLTSLCMMIGNYFKKNGFTCALAELHPNGDFRDICDAFEQADTLKSRNESSFEAAGMTFFPGISEFCQISGKRFDVLILDLGLIKNEGAIRELSRADIKLILCPGAVWKFPRIFETLEQLKYAQNGWIYAVCSSQKNEEQMLKELYRLSPVVTFPLVINPFTISKDVEKHISSAIDHIFSLSGLPKRLPRGRFL